MVGLVEVRGRIGDRETGIMIGERGGVEKGFRGVRGGGGGGEKERGEGVGLMHDGTASAHRERRMDWEGLSVSDV